MRILVVGYGRMGRLVERLAPEHGCTVAGIADVDPPLDVLAARQVNVVIGTTGWQEHEASLRDRAARAGIGVLASANFSIGMNIFRHLVEQAARTFESTDFGAWIHEKHHDRKKDAPSGTALLLKAALDQGGFSRGVDVSSTRAGYIPGVHEVGFDGPSETVTLTHTVRDRAVFAHGALEAAKWLRGRQGWFSMRDMIQSR